MPSFLFPSVATLLLNGLIYVMHARSHPAAQSSAVLNAQAEEEFWALTGESADTLKEGRLVEARVVFVTADRVKCQLPEFGGLEAELDAADISSRVHGFVDARQCLERGAVVTARCVLVGCALCASWLL